MPEPLPLSPSSQDRAMLAWMDDFAPYGVITTDPELRIKSWNHWMASNSSFTFEAVAGRSLFDLFPDLNERRLGSHFARALGGQISVLSTALHGYLIPLPSSLNKPGFSQMRQTARIAPLVLEGEISGTIILIEDVTEREFQAEILRGQQRRDQLLSWALAHLLKAEHPRRTARDLFLKVAEQLDFDAYFLYLFSAEAHTLRLQAAGGIPPEKEGDLANFPADGSCWLPDLNATEALIAERVQTETGDRTLPVRGLGITAYAAFPLLASGRFQGCLCFATRTRDTLPRAEIDLLSTIAQYLAVALNRESTELELRAVQSSLHEHALVLERRVTERTQELKETIAELETFSYTLAHDLRAPIRALMGYCDVLREDYGAAMPAEAEAIVGKLARSCGRLGLLIRDLLDFTRVSRQQLQVEPIDVGEILADVIALGPPGMSQKVVIRPPLHLVKAHRTLLQQSLANLLDNAFKFVPVGQTPEVVIWTELVSETERIPIVRRPFHDPMLGLQDSAPAETGIPERRIRIWVQDRGIGIAPEAHGKIFGIFERGPSSNQYEGTGIGLAIVARAMQRMGGSCGLESTLGVGSQFWLELPQA